MTEAPAIEDVFPQIAMIEDERIARAARAMWADIWARSNWDDFEKMPTSPEIAYPARPHAQCVVAMAITLADTLTSHHGVKIDRDRLIAAAILQDVSKLIEYEPDGDGGARLSETGKLHQHAFLAAHLALSHGMPDEIVDAIANHTPQSARFPLTLEGKILYYVDQIDIIAIHGDRWRKEVRIAK